MPVVIYRQPWFWAVLVAAIAVLVFGVVIAASGPGRDSTDSTTIVQPSPPTPAPPPPSATVPPAPPEKPVIVEVPKVIREIPKVIREKTVVIREKDGEKKTPGAERTAPDEFQSTGLKKEIRFDESGWEARATMTVADPASELKEIGAAEDGTPLYVSVNAQEPYQSVLAPVPDEEGKYVQYRRR